MLAILLQFFGHSKINSYLNMVGYWVVVVWHLWNIGKFLPNYTARQARSQPSLYSSSWESHISVTATYCSKKKKKERKSSNFRHALRRGRRLIDWQLMPRNSRTVRSKWRAVTRLTYVRVSWEEHRLCWPVKRIWSRWSTCFCYETHKSRKQNVIILIDKFMARCTYRNSCNNVPGPAL
jgi:hypothetical protein